MTPEELHDVAVKSNAVLDTMATDYIQWVHTYVAQDRLFCVYNADSAEVLQEHARRGGFACDTIRLISAVIDPVTGEQ